VVYHISVRRIGPGRTLTLEVDGRPVSGNIVPLPPAGTKEVFVRATLL